jgi:hypothetical protein
MWQEDGRKIHVEELHDVYSTLGITAVTKSRVLIWREGGGYYTQRRKGKCIERFLRKSLKEEFVYKMKGKTQG